MASGFDYDGALRKGHKAESRAFGRNVVSLLQHVTPNSNVALANLPMILAGYDEH